MAFTFSFKSSTKSQIELNTFRNFNRIVLGDSIKELYPKAEVNIKDQIGLFSEILGFVEGSEWEFLYGDDEDASNQIKFKSVWEGNQLTDFYRNYYVSGHNTLNFIDKNILKDNPKSKSYQGKISDVVTQVMKSYGFLKTTIENTMNNGIWGQGLIRDEDFINELLKYAYSVNNGKEPMFSFIDLNGGYHFETISNMLKQNQSIMEFTLNQGNAENFEVFTVNDLKLIWKELESNLDNYNSAYHYLDLKASESKKEEKKINDMIPQSGKLPVLKNNASDIKSHRFFGFVNSDKEVNKNKDFGLDEYNGWIASHYKNQQAWLVMRLVLKGAIPKAVSGQVVSTKFNSLYEKRGTATEFSGKWVIVQSKHLISKEYLPFTEIFLTRNYVDFNSQNVFKQELI